MLKDYVICIIDDEEDVLEYLKSCVEGFGYKTITSVTATEAIKEIKSCSNEVVCALIDFLMPGINGIEVLKILKQNFPEIVCIMLTGYPQAEKVVEALNAGAFTYLIKPVEPNMLNAILRNAIAFYEAKKEKKPILEETTETLVYIVLCKDKDDKIIKATFSLEKVLGYEKGELLGKHISQVFTEEYVKSYFRRLLEEEEVRDFPFWLKTKDGDELKLKFSGTILKKEDEILSLLGTLKIKMSI